MQTLVTQGLVLNRRHADAVGCFFAVPVMERGGDTVRDVAWSGSKGLGQPVWTGTRSYVNQRRGRALNISVGNTVATPSTGQPWSNDFSVCATVTITTPTNQNAVVRCGGFLFGVRSIGGTVSLWDNGATVVSNGPAITASVESTIGVRWRTGVTPDFFLNGVRSLGDATVAITSVATKTTIGGQAAVADMVGTVRDVRIWNRFMPDATFRRYHYDPYSFYMPDESMLVSAPFLGGQFMPFLHPSLQS